MQAAEAWGNRWTNAVLPMARRYMEVATKKQSLVCLAADKNTMSGLFQLVEEVGPFIAALKTHVDLIDDWTPEAWVEFCQVAKHLCNQQGEPHA